MVRRRLQYRLAKIGLAQGSLLMTSRRGRGLANKQISDGKTKAKRGAHSLYEVSEKVARLITESGNLY
jgi:hypothetical protein